MTGHSTFGEMMIAAIARTIEDGTLVFHGFGSPLVQMAMHVAKQSHAPNMVLVAGATYGINPRPPFLAPTSNDWVMDRGAECSLDIEELFDLAAAGRMGRMFLSGLQIDKWGGCNVTKLGGNELKLKLPGGGGGCNLSCDVDRLTLWTASHRATTDGKGRRSFRLVKQCDFITNLGHRTADGRRPRDLGHRGNGPQWVVTELGVFDFDGEGHMRLRALYPDTTVDDVLENTEFAPRLFDPIEIVALPDSQSLSLIRRLDPMKIHERELRETDRSRHFSIE
jgi:glutaconate CoA-transferase subunit B